MTNLTVSELKSNLKVGDIIYRLRDHVIEKHIIIARTEVLESRIEMNSKKAPVRIKTSKDSSTIKLPKLLSYNGENGMVRVMYTLGTHTISSQNNILNQVISYDLLRYEEEFELSPGVVIDRMREKVIDKTQPSEEDEDLD